MKSVFTGGQTIARHLRRFFADSLPERGKKFTLRGEEAHHMLGVVRVRKGEEVELFDGSGVLARARLVDARRGEAVLDVLSADAVDVEPQRRMTLACALPRATRMDFLVEKCCELGLARLIPMVTQRSVVDPVDRQQNHLQRWRRITIESAKQCGGTRLTEVTAVLHFDAALLTLEPDVKRMIASPEPDAMGLSEFAAGVQPSQPVVAAVGPEGGFTPEEVHLARSRGYVPVSLGLRIFRVETAAVVLCACLLVK